MSLSARSSHRPAAAKPPIKRAVAAPRPATPPAVPAQVAAPAAGLFDIPQPGQVNAAPSEQLKQICGGCRLSFNWFGSKNVQVSKATKKTMAESVDTTEEGISVSKRLISSKHAVIKEANELKRRIESTWRSMSLPLATAATDEIRVEGGTRLIKREDIPEFDRRMQALLPEAQAMEKRVNESMGDIMEMDRQRLKGQFNAKDYPKSVTLSFNWGYPAIAVPSYLKDLAPEVYARELRSVQQRFERTFELAYLDFLGQFAAIIETWVERLGPVTRIYPPEGHALAAHHGAEVLERVGHEQDESVPAGQFNVRVRRKVSGQKEQQEFVLGPFTQAQYADLHPSEVDNERKVFKDSTIEGLTDMLGKFRRLGNAVSASPQFQGVVKEIETHLAKLPTSEAVAKELRNSHTFRQQTQALMQKLHTRLEAETDTFKKSRRKIDRGAVSED